MSSCGVAALVSVALLAANAASFELVAVAVAAVAGLALLLWWANRRRVRMPAYESLAIVGTRAVDPGQLDSSVTERLFAATTRLLGVTARREIDRAIVREALSVVHAEGGALVDVEIGDRSSTIRLSVGWQSAPTLLDPAGLHRGVIGRVAEMGRPVFLSTTAEPALDRTPASLAVVPLTESGTVRAVLVLIRSSSAPFTPDEQMATLAFSAIAVSALGAASEAVAEVGALSLDDPRTLGRELPIVLATAHGGPTSILAIATEEGGSSELASILSAELRPTDAAYRVDDQTTVVVLPVTFDGEAESVAERLRERCRREGRPEPAMGVASTFGTGAGSDPTGVAGGREVLSRSLEALDLARSDRRRDVVVLTALPAF